MASYQLNAEIVRTEELAPGICRITVSAPAVSSQAKPGQFLMIKASDDKNNPLLRRPFSIHQATAGDRVQILFRVVGKGTRFLAEKKCGEKIEVVGPLGKGFSFSGWESKDSVCLVGGGMGIAPLYYLAKELIRTKRLSAFKVLLGAPAACELQVLKRDFENLGVDCLVATDDGSMGHHGFVTDFLAKQLDNKRSWKVCCCGPHPMMEKTANLCMQEGWSCQVSLETMMACGISACLGCTVGSSVALRTRTGRPYLHVCKDGPVFEARDVAWHWENK